MKKSTIFISLAIAAPLGAATYWFIAQSRLATRSPRYRLVRKDGDVELRDYPHLTVMNAQMDQAGMDSSFRRLFRYITGGNQRRQKISMTTPVLIETAGGNRTMGFIMPEEDESQSIPMPADSSVSRGEIEAGQFAALRFKGEPSRNNESEAAERLRQWVAARGLVGRGEPIVAYYDPPWTPVWLRRNEVLLPVSGEAGESTGE